MICSPGCWAADGALAGVAVGLKPGRAAGDGLALPDEDAAEVARRFGAMAAELGAKTELGRALGLRAATLTIRLERCYRNESARLGLAVDSAEKAYVDGRLAEVETLLEGISSDPLTNARRLQQTPEGVRLTIDAWKALRDDLLHPELKLWSAAHWERAENLLGRRTDDLPRSRIGALSKAMWYDFSAMEHGEADGLNERGRYEYARDRLAEIIDGRIEALTGFLGRFDPAAEDRARAGAADRALFDDSKVAVLARKHEASTERSLFRTLRELREVEAAAAGARASSAEGEPDPAGLGSIVPGGSEGEPAAAGAVRKAGPGRPGRGPAPLGRPEAARKGSRRGKAPAG